MSGFGFWSRAKSFLGGGKTTTLPSATTLVIPDDTNTVFVSGSTTVTKVSVNVSSRNRRLTLIGAASASVLFTNNNTPSSDGQMYLAGANVLLQEDDVLELFVKDTGYITIVGTTSA